jgi:hypothetical protein
VYAPPLAEEPSRSVSRAARLRGEPRLPGDKSISHRALILATLAGGDSTITGAGDGRDVQATAGIMAALGASIERVREDGLNVDYRVVSPGADGIMVEVHPNPDEARSDGEQSLTFAQFADMAGALTQIHEMVKTLTKDPFAMGAVKVDGASKH